MKLHSMQEEAENDNKDELISAQKEYIEFLEETVGDIAVIKKFINKSISQDLIDKGKQLHKKIAEIENN